MSARQMLLADALFSKIVRARDGHCVRCGSHDHLECAHIIGRSHKSIRCDLGNAITLCRDCHRHFTERPKLWAQWVDNKYPGLRQTLHMASRRAVGSGDRVDWAAKLAELKDEGKRWNL